MVATITAKPYYGSAQDRVERRRGPVSDAIRQILSIFVDFATRDKIHRAVAACRRNPLNR
jgi:hypothetical protein